LSSSGGNVIFKINSTLGLKANVAKKHAMNYYHNREILAVLIGTNKFFLSKNVFKLQNNQKTMKI